MANPLNHYALIPINSDNLNSFKLNNNNALISWEKNLLTNTSQLVNELKHKKVKPAEVNEKLEAIGTAPLKEGTSLLNLLRRPNVTLNDIKNLSEELSEYLNQFSEETLEQAEINIKYESYIEKEQQMVDKMQKLEDLAIPNDFDYGKLSAISIEGRQKLSKIRPATIGQASRISGVSASDISVLMVFMGR